ncbi:hypothetical protein QH494_16140 [Sphingomonas sp. AR_OL41]|uniref:hypothetical protein n=1 Tax=Sphingomonas sp. AR_OL41 TaxID=3042729 RepID=UPI002480D7DC|nr:hypothetical protein [Sphingomonas sp. AR_OL41]MDH7973723.1 hypothetical protein [Sphingomonas sp. AR_OL41]
MKIARRIDEARHIVRRWWWIASGEKQRILDEHAHFRRWGAEQFNRTRAADHAV